MDKNNKVIKFLACAIIFVLFLFTGCKPKSYSTLPQTKYENILNESANSYYVVIYSVTCDYCKRLEEDVVNYYKKTLNSNQYPKLYVTCIDLEENAKMKSSSDDEYLNFVGSSNYQDVKFSSYPALIFVENKTVKNLISSKTTNRPYTEIKNLLTQTIGE